MKKIKNGFTLVELLAVIVILAIILVIAVPKVMSVIEDSKKATLESTAKMIASSAEKAKVQNTVLGKVETITCESVAKINSLDYESCSIEFDGNTAKVTITGSGKFDGLWVCNGTKTDAEAQSKSCVLNAVSFEKDDWATIVVAVQSGNHPYEVGDTKTIDLGDLGEHTLRVSNTRPCSETSVESKTACGFVLEFADIITTRMMNEDGSNYFGWAFSEMRTYVNNTIYNAIPEELRNGIIDTFVVSSYSLNGKWGYSESGNYETTDKIYLLSPEEVYGLTFTLGYESSNVTSRQLDWYSKEAVRFNGYTSEIKYDGEDSVWWWLRSARNDDNSRFFGVGIYGEGFTNPANGNHGVSPAFRLSE